jgi:hypothetical protein
MNKVAIGQSGSPVETMPFGRHKGRANQIGWITSGSQAIRTRGSGGMLHQCGRAQAWENCRA